MPPPTSMARGQGRGDDFCVPPQHEEPRPWPFAMHPRTTSATALDHALTSPVRNL